ncbi:protein of unknown function UPF0005 [Thermodesulfobium narugense DSM 14796]|uniref:Uncharacterized protein n=1 Tax=Thermodesulfobium narugense DSM 14796 TaxID=747365 RepID=M1E9C9_9BACT|nr:Bax inhibitor-1/YccA family protein [Thermodesulfobium narugense]AEE15084.1 protein of unknown function UPF0005 [Thermodesulfobium narugense DSM 14796]
MYRPYNDELTSRTVALDVSGFFRGVFTWMFLGLLFTGVISYLVASNDSILRFILSNPILFYGIIALQFAAVITLSAAITKLPAEVAEFIFILYSTLTGVTFSTLFVIYTSSSIASTFFVTAISFGVMALLGYTTKADLTKMGTFMMAGLIAIIIGFIINIFLHSSALVLLLSVVGVIVFLGLTAYDMQKLKKIYAAGLFDERKETVLGALTLYLDFINLFLMLLNIMGNRRD